MARILSRRRDRGATLVEYALLVALVAAGCIAALQTLEKEAGERYEESAAGIGDDGTSGGTPDGETPDGETPDGETPEPPAASASCSAKCTINATNLPEGSTVTWSVSPSAGNQQSDGTSFSFNPAKNTTYTVTGQVAPSNQTITRVVSCSNDPKPVCT